MTSSVCTLLAAADSLETRAPGSPGMGAIIGPSGSGKTRAGQFLCARTNAVHVRARRLWKPRWMLEDISQALGIAPVRSLSHMMQMIEEILTAKGRLLMIDEADNIVKDGRDADLIETVRDIADFTAVPVILIGEENLQLKLKHWERLYSRIAQWIKFGPATMRDARILCDTNCEVAVRDDLLARLHSDAGGSIRRLSVGLEAIERFAKVRRLESVNLAAWGARSFYAAPTEVAENVVSLTDRRSSR